jgi:hypothetical protein
VRSGPVGSPRPPMKISSASRKPIMAQFSAMVHTVWYATPVHAAEIWPRRRACRGPSGRRQQTTSRDPSAFDQTLFPRSPTPADGRCRTRRLADVPSATKPPARRSRTRKTGGPRSSAKVLDGSLRRPEPRRKVQKPSYRIPFHRSALCSQRAGWPPKHLANCANWIRILDLVVMQECQIHFIKRYCERFPIIGEKHVFRH